MNLIDTVAQLRTDKKYVRIRTDYGTNFDTFYENGFVAIGYNYLGRRRLLAENQSLTRQLIATNESLSESNVSDKKKISRIFNMVHEFKDLRRGDVVVIPSKDSGIIAFGEIADEELYLAEEGAKDCEYIKRRSVRWFKVVNWSELDPKLQPLKTRGDAINSFNELSSEIDKVMRYLFVKNELAHFVIDINKNEPIRLIELIRLLNSIKELSQLIIDHYNLRENVEDITIKLNVQSPGITELIKSGKALLVVAAMVTVNSCNSGESGLSPNDEQEALDLNNQFSNEIDAIISSLDSLEVPASSRHFYKQ